MYNFENQTYVRNDKDFYSDCEILNFESTFTIIFFQKHSKFEINTQEISFFRLTKF